jgi:hypothetical protein
LGIVWILEYCLGDDVNDMIYNGLCDGALHAQQGEDVALALQQIYENNSFFCKQIFLLWQTKSHCAFLLDSIQK